MSLPLVVPNSLYSAPTGRFSLIGQAGEVFRLPLQTALGETRWLTRDELLQGPAVRAGLRIGWGTSALPQLRFGTDEAGLGALLIFPNEQATLQWERNFLRAARKAVAVVDSLGGQRLEGFVTEVGVQRRRYPNLLTFHLVFQSLQPGWLQEMARTISGSPATCPNTGPESAYPRLAFTATGGAASVSDGTRVLSLTGLAAGVAVVIDASSGDGRVTVAGNPTVQYLGRFPLVSPGGSTISLTGGSGLSVGYRELV